MKAGEVHVWRADLSNAAALAPAYDARLTVQERARAARFVFPRDRDRFLVSHGILRTLLGTYLGRPPLSVAFVLNAYGKPALAGGHPLRFNLSHSHDLALYAFALDRDVGVDVERIRPDFATDRIARRFFSPGECAALEALPPEDRVAGFFRCWTRKEAYIKAKGKGLSLALDCFDVSLGSDARLLRSAGEPDDEQGWSLWDLQPGEGYCGAVMAAGAGYSLRVFEAAP